MDREHGTGMTAADLTAALAPEFEILRLLGEGSTAAVYLAREAELRRLVAIKVPLPELAVDPVVRQRFEREARAAARIRHESAAAVHRIGRLADGTPYLVFEYIEGRRLDDVLRAEGPFEEALAVRVLAQIAAALAEAHAQGVVHRDVRPGNVFWIDSAERAVLTDFGIAGILESGAEVITRLTQPGQPLGDPAYRSPEQLLGEPLTPEADIYGLALLAYELLTLQRPYMAATNAAIAVAHLRQPPRDLRDLLPAASPRLADLLTRCLAKNPHHRPSATAVVDALERLAEQQAPPPHDAGGGVVERALVSVPAVGAFLAELRRRRVYNVAIAYAVLCFFVLQAAQLVLPALPLPAWTYPLFVATALAGFPVALVLAWMYDFTAAGIERTEAAELGGPRYLRWLLPGIGLAISLAIAALIGWWVLSARNRTAAVEPAACDAAGAYCYSFSNAAAFPPSTLARAAASSGSARTAASARSM
jgi:hypothetical protein